MRNLRASVVAMNEDPRLIRANRVLLFVALTCITWNAAICFAQDDFYPLPERNRSNFGFPYPPPLPDEPGVTFNRRYMLDGHPEYQFRPRPQDEVWLVSTRNISGYSWSVTADQLVCKRAVGHQWEQLSMQDLLASQQSEPDKETVLFVHGNRTSAFWSRRRGKIGYQVLVGSNPLEMPPVRFIIWSWPSDPLSRPVQDFQVKMDRSLVDGHLLGLFLASLDPQRPLSLVTYSLGTQIGFTGIETATLERGSCPPVGMIAMAPVTHCGWNLSGEQLDVINHQVYQLRFCNNQKDTALKAYRAICSVTCRKCFTPKTETIARRHPNCCQYDFSRSVGSEHNIVGYVSQPQVRHELQQLMTR